jgi:hypothetical protein
MLANLNLLVLVVVVLITAYSGRRVSGVHSHIAI